MPGGRLLRRPTAAQAARPATKRDLKGGAAPTAFRCPGRGAARSGAPLIRDPGCFLPAVAVQALVDAHRIWARRRVASPPRMFAITSAATSWRDRHFRIDPVYAHGRLLPRIDNRRDILEINRYLPNKYRDRRCILFTIAKGTLGRRRRAGRAIPRSIVRPEPPGRLRSRPKRRMSSRWLGLLAITFANCRRAGAVPWMRWRRRVVSP
jgi:hypothetical protein